MTEHWHKLPRQAVVSFPWRFPKFTWNGPVPPALSVPAGEWVGTVGRRIPCQPQQF